MTKMDMTDRTVEAALAAAREAGRAEGRAQASKSAVRAAVAAVAPRPAPAKPAAKRPAPPPPRVLSHQCPTLDPMSSTRGKVVLDASGKGTCDRCHRTLWADL